MNLTNIGDVSLLAKDLEQLGFIIVDIALHNFHAGSQETLKGIDIQDC
jgi:hypothetical protein